MLGRNRNVPITDDEWELRISEFFYRTGLIKINADADPSQQKVLIAKIDELIGDILYYLRVAEDLYEDIDELVDLVLKSNYGGTNEQDRKKASWEKAESYILNGVEVNLMEMRRIARSRCGDLKAIAKALEGKQGKLLMFCSINKIESNINY